LSSMVSILYILLLVSICGIGVAANGMVDSVTVDTNAGLCVALRWPIARLNPVSPLTFSDVFILGLIFEPLVIPNPYNYSDPLHDIPWVLNGTPTWEVLPGNISVWTLRIRDDIFFFDGEKLDSSDIKFTLDFLKWVGEYRWSGLLEVLINVTIVDDTMVRVYLNTAGYMTARKLLDIPIYPKHIYERAEVWGGSNGTFPRWDVVPMMVTEYTPSGPDDPILTGYGAFRLTWWDEQTPGESEIFVLERNPNYFMRAVDENGNIIWEWHRLTPEYIDTYGPDAFRGPYMKTVKFRVVTDPAEITSLMLSGEIDMASGIDLWEYYTNLTNANLTLKYTYELSELVAIINVNRWPLNMTGVRRALYYAFNRTGICGDVFGGWARPLYSPLPTIIGDWCYRPVIPSEINYTEIAREYLESVNITDRDGDGWLEDMENREIVLEIICYNDPSLLGVASELRENLEDIGIHAEVTNMTYTDFLIRIINDNYGIAVDRLYVDRLPYVLESFRSIPVIYIDDWKNDTYNLLIEEAFYHEENISIIKQLLWDAQKVLIEECPYIPLCENIIIGVAVGGGSEEDPAGIFNLDGRSIINRYTLLKAAIFVCTTTIIIVDTFPPPEEGGGQRSSKLAYLPIIIIVVTSLILILRCRRTYKED